MGSKQLDKPRKMGEKLRKIRLNLGLTQEQMFEKLQENGAKIHVGYIGLYEIGERLPTLLVTLAYARSCNISMETLVDDTLDI